MNLNPLAAEEQFLNPLDRVNGFDIRPGLYEINGATSFGSCVNFTIHSQNAVWIFTILSMPIGWTDRTPRKKG